MIGSESSGVAPRGQWGHARLFGVSLPIESQLSLDEGYTPLDSAEVLGSALGIPSLKLKREDFSPTGSHKARCLSLLCSTLAASGGRQAVISSSGNASVAAAAYSSLRGIRLLSLVSPRTPRVKLARLRGYPGLTVISDQPVALLHHAVRSWNLADLRGSINPLAPNAYRGISAELVPLAPLAALFIFCSSGASALGISQGFDQLLEPGSRPELHVVEGTPGGELTRPWYTGSAPDPMAETQFGELGSRRSRLSPTVRRAVRSSGGRGWRVSSSDAAEVKEIADALGLRTSWEGIATLAAMRQAAAAGAVGRSGNWIAVLTGDQEQLDLEESRPGHPLFPIADSADELDLLLADADFTRADEG